VSAWLYVVAALLDLAPAVYEYEARREFEPHLESCDPLADAICPRCNTLHALADWKCPSCKGVLSFDIHRVEGKRKVFGNCAACGVYAPDFTCTGCARNMTDRF
jgi:phage FluMu protein Com